MSEDIRKKAGKQLAHYAVTQGACSDGEHIWMIFERKKPHRCKVVKMTADTHDIVKVSGALKLGHGNDCCIRSGILYITHSGGSKTVHRVNAKTLTKAKGGDVEVKGVKAGGFNGITCFGEGFALKKMGSQGIYIVDKGFRYKRKIKLSKRFSVSQGLTFRGGRFYRGSSRLQSKKNYVSIYSEVGKYIKRKQYAHKCELEGVFFVDDVLYATVYKKYKKKKKGKTYYEAYIVKM